MPYTCRICGTYFLSMPPPNYICTNCNNTTRPSWPRCIITYDLLIDAYRLKINTSNLGDDYNQFKTFISLFKQLLPGGERDYDDQRKEWVFKKQYITGVLKLSHTIWSVANVKYISEADAIAGDKSKQQKYIPPQQPNQQTSITNRRTPIDEICIQFIKLLPHNCLRKAWIAAQLEMHPDKHVNGDKEIAVTKIAEINAAWARIEKEIYNK